MVLLLIFLKCTVSYIHPGFLKRPYIVFIDIVYYVS